MSQVKVVVQKVGAEPSVWMIDDNLEAFQAVVGGDIEMLGLGGNVAIICNEEGMLNNLPQNRCGILGDFFFVKTGKDGNSIDLSDDEVAAIFQYCETWKDAVHPSKTEDDQDSD